MSLDTFIPVVRVTDPNQCGGSVVDCATTLIKIKPCLRTPVDPGEGLCVNDIARRPWPSPPPVEIGCNPVNVAIINTVPPEDDEDQTSIRLEGEVTYIAGDACLPKLNLKLIAPPSFRNGGGSPNQYGYGYTSYGECIPVGPGQDYENPQEFAGNAQGAEAFYPTSQNDNTGCQPCTHKARFGASVAKFNLIGPFLAEITGNCCYDQRGWKYEWNALQCVIARNTCIGACGAAKPWYDSVGSILSNNASAYNIKENITGANELTPGVDLTAMLATGYKPVAIVTGTIVLMYGFVPWGTDIATNTNGTKKAIPNCASTECDIVWFFDEQNAFQGECIDPANPGTPAQPVSMLPQRNITSAGMFFGVPSSADRV